MKFLSITAAFALLAVLQSDRARAEVYRYIDEDGVVHFTNVPDDPRFQPLDREASRRRALPVPKQKRLVLDTYDSFIEEASKRFNIPMALIKAVIAIESNFDPKAISRAGAQGLMQLMPTTATEMGVRDVFDPRQNILGGTRYLRVLTNSYNGDLVLTLASYNAGQKQVNRAMKIPPIAETQSYVRRVLRLYFAFKDQAAGKAFTASDADPEPDGS